ncbi:uncharacterized protein LOC105831471 [Monomorium pharaonis]|uniref:uncharacterized protein LOC105831471 n=1 Tax=Monomorium pharaonis TaxID=307658 RepID=UPI001747C906|nr:uncharacterized protein LOC105831471 [Monomorium pharaonis]XP_036149463.1 uncharacterized protein LOC105831471 [Monomorium pharaonis]
METRECVSNFTVKDEPVEISGEKQHIRDSIDHGKVIVVVSPTETKPLASNEYLRNKKLNNMNFLNVISSMHSLVKKNFDNDDDDKENVMFKRISGESKQSCSNREVDKIFPPPQQQQQQQQQQQTQANRSPRRKSTGIPTLLCIDGNRPADAAVTGVKRKIPRPANAFMLFANEWRRKLAAENPRESNKDISVRLGIFWKNMSKDVKEKYFALAREVDKEHKRKYPGRSCKEGEIVLFFFNVSLYTYNSYPGESSEFSDLSLIYGARARALRSYVTDYHILPMRRIARTMRENKITGERKYR